jgi:DNA relaxase NicK
MTPQKTSVDWLRFRVKAEPRDALKALQPMFGNMGQYLHLGDLGRGILGFRHSLPVILADMPAGRMDFGGEAQRDWVRVDMPGKGCEWVQDWQAAQGIEDLQDAEIRRVDIALTTWDGEMGHEAVVQAHQDGRFVTRGRPPALQQIISSDPRAGRTCYVGKREKSDKFFRAYEKGFEMAAKYPGQLVECIEGKRVEDIYRCELELKAESSNIPWEVIERRDQYFAGAYPFCADLLPGIEADILMRRPERAPQTDLAVALENCRIQYGAALFTALTAYHGDIGAVWDRIVGDKHSQALVEAGVLMVEHDIS